MLWLAGPAAQLGSPYHPRPDRSVGCRDARPAQPGARVLRVPGRPPGEKRDPALLEYAVRLAPGGGRKRVRFIPTADGDSPGAIDAVTGVFAGRADVDPSVLTLFPRPGVPDARAYLLAQDVLLVGGARAWWVEPPPAAATATSRSRRAGCSAGCTAGAAAPAPGGP
jgi:hypothetical protein